MALPQAQGLWIKGSGGGVAADREVLPLGAAQVVQHVMITLWKLLRSG
jgi:hypothetical protein